MKYINNEIFFSFSVRNAEVEDIWDNQWGEWNKNSYVENSYAVHVDLNCHENLEYFQGSGKISKIKELNLIHLCLLHFILS